MAQKEIPCYLFVGMLESGKTTLRKAKRNMIPSDLPLAA